MKNERVEAVTKYLCENTGTDAEHYYRQITLFYFGILASTLQQSIELPSRERIPINLYIFNLMPSGAGKGFGLNIVEKIILEKGIEYYKKEVEEHAKTMSFEAIAEDLMINDPTLDLADVLEKLEKDLSSLGVMWHTFESATVPSIRQLRDRILYAGSGSLNLIVDEFGDNINQIYDALIAYLSLYDKGFIKNKLLKSTTENVRTLSLTGSTPANLLAFGTPVRVLDGSENEETLNKLLDTGYARRSLFCYMENVKSPILTPREMLDMELKHGVSAFDKRVDAWLYMIIQKSNYRKPIKISEDVYLEILEYKAACLELANEIPDIFSIKQTETKHRHFKVLKISGLLAFIDNEEEISSDHVKQSIAIVEESAENLEKIITTKKPYARLCKHLANIEEPMTLVDMLEDLSFMPTTITKQRELIKLAKAWGFKRNIIIQEKIKHDVEFYQAKVIKELEGNNISLSFSKNITEGYMHKTVLFKDLHKLTCKSGWHWVSHDLISNYRNEENCIPGFNMIVLDVDDNVKLQEAELFFKDYQYLIHTTKSHTEASHRFRIILPMSHELKLDKDDYRAFMRNISNWIPFQLDEATFQRSRKWLSNNSEPHYNEGSLFDIIRFIPDTEEEKQTRKLYNSSPLKESDAIERWFIYQTEKGNRSNMLVRYSFFLKETGLSSMDIESKVLTLNAMLSEPLREKEVYSTIIKTIRGN